MKSRLFRYLLSIQAGYGKLGKWQPTKGQLILFVIGLTITSLGLLIYYFPNTIILLGCLIVVVALAWGIVVERRKRENGRL